MKALRLCSLFLTCLAGPVWALDPGKAITQFKQDSWDTERGLPTNQVNAIVRTRDGYIWVATSGGLARFNGMTFTVFTMENTPGLPANDIWSLLEDHAGALWVGTNEGLVRYDGRRFSVVVPEYSMLALAEDTDGAIWMGSWGAVRRFKDGRTTTVDAKEGLAERVTASRGGGVWGRVAGGGVKRVRDRHVETLADTRPLLVTRMAEDRDGALWLGAAGDAAGLYRLLNGELKRYGQPTDLPHPIINVFYQDRVGSLWIGTQGGLSRLASGRFGSYTLKDGLPDNVVRALCEDQEGSLWIGTAGAGLVRLRDGSFTTYTIREGLSLNALRTVYATSDGAVWAGTNGNGASRFKDGVFTTFNRASGLPMNSVDAIAEDAAGGMWFGSYQERQTAYYKSGRFVQYPGRSARSLLVDGDTVWIGEGSGVVRLKDGKFDLLKPESGPKVTTNVWTIHKDVEGRIWLGLQGRLCEVKGDKVPCLPLPKTQHVSPPVLGMHDDPRGGLWLGTWVGLFHFQDGVFRRYGVDVGLPEIRIMTVLEDSQRDLWLCTSNAVLRIRREILERFEAKEIPKLTYDTYDATHGMRSAQFDYDGTIGCRARDGRLWFASMGGLISVDPTNVATNTWVPPVKIEDVLVDKRKIEPEQLGRLKPGTGEIEIHYAGLSYLIPERVRFKYKLEGFDPDWVDPGTRHVAYYTNLPHGTYTFKVKACNNDGLWNETGAEVRFYLPPHWYQTWWFRGFIALLLGSVAYAGYQWRVAALKGRERDLAQRVTDRTTDLEREITEHRHTEERLAESNRDMANQKQKLADSNRELSEGKGALERQQAALALENEERRRAEETAGRERDLLYALMDNIPDLIYFKDTQSRFLRINQAQAKALGVRSAEEAVGKTDAEFFEAGFARSTLSAEQELFRSGHSILGKLERESRSGRWYLATKVALRNAAGEITGLVGISRDLTERKEAEETLARDLKAFQETVDAVARGDLSLRGEEGDETVRQIARAVNRMLESFSTILAEARDAAFSVSSSSSQILSAATQIAKGAEYGRDEVHTTSVSVEQMAASMTKVLEHADASAELAREVLGHVEQSDRAVDAVYLGMTNIDTAVAETSGKMRLLEQRGQEIFEIIGLIEEIASQSKLLSLNAAIEAAHAGDAGRGFAVVADEVRHLADSSTQAAKDVSERLKGIVQETQVVLQAMENAMREVKEGRALSDQARKRLHEIPTLVQNSVHLATQISGASREQAEATKTVAQAMQTIANITMESAASASETSKAVRDLVRLSEQLSQAIARFKIS